MGSMDMFMLMLFFVSSLLMKSGVQALRCYVSVDITRQPGSVECGINAGCLKVYIDSEELLMKLRRKSGYVPGFGKMPQLPSRFQDNPVVYRGCFVLQVPDRCYNAQDGYTYCWCSTKDLCNKANSKIHVNHSHLITLTTLQLFTASMLLKR